MIRLLKLYLPAFGLALLFTACTPPSAYPGDVTVYYNGDILTMEGDSARYVEAVAVQYGKIAFAGKKSGALRMMADAVQLIDLRGKTLLPGFIDAHGHVGGYASFMHTANLLPSPYGTVMSIPDLQQALRNYIRDLKIPPGTAVIGNGYDDANMREHRHPTQAQLDAVSTKHPIYIIHQSGHMGVANSLLLQQMGISYATPDPTGGVIGRDSKRKKLTGKLMENAHIQALYFLMKQTPAPDETHKFDDLLAAEQIWFANGQTTLCEGKSSPAMVNLIREASDRGLLHGDFILLPDYDAYHDSLQVLKKAYRHYQGHYKIGAIKLTFDGSPQGKSAWLTQPYLVPPEGANKDYRGQPIYTHEAAYQALKKIFEQGMQAHVHCNGDAAIDEGLNLMDTLRREGLRTSDMRCVLVHSQVARPDQVPRFKELGIMPSWFPTHTYLWGDWHLHSVLGRPRAQHISPLKQGLDNGIRFTIHHDAPVTPPDLLTAVYSAVNRTTRTGIVLGADQRITPYEALKAITINAAWQWGEEKEKGTLRKGKRADLVILDRNPLKVEPALIKDIKVMETIKDGVTVFKKQ
ncbi:amidohydrolase [Paraflavitalea sp. CAU 1676]|uniref:amidohydrolase n=1 Tax=Paraflavitalea sp. CAU 1676 TaxID=3032598 RepID=UPI0023DB3988|nr:amidohydrolase [Paraflavitalea sp. CAU 1676]MDF2189054.1 amidohydrolase [Paraflavitalea sp. CAU 1676]